MSILQWNCRGYRRNYSDFTTLLARYQPACICLQESLLGNTIPRPPQQYVIETYNPVNLPHPGNGLVTLINRNYANLRLDLNTPLQALAVRIQFPNRRVTICNIYISPNTAINQADMQNLIDQLPPPFLLLGDFNAKHPSWGCNTTNQHGRTIEQILMTANICTMNTGENTHFHTQTGTSSAIDLSICSADLMEEFSWRTESDLHGSDHYPIILKPLQGEPARRERRPIFRKADWKTFRALTAMDELDEVMTTDELVEHFTHVVTVATSVSIPHSEGNPKRNCVPWWTDECARMKIRRKQALRRYQRTKSVADKITYNRERAHAQFVQNQARKASWRNYVSSINAETPMTKCWKRVMKMSGKHLGQSQPFLVHNGVEVSDGYDVATTFADHFHNISSNQNAPPQFLANKQRQEETPISLETLEHFPYNEPISMMELHSALKTTKNSAPGPDRISYTELKRIHPTALSYLLKIYNTIWLQETFPNQWRLATVIAFPKPGKPPRETSSYRPIALTTCIGKLLERIIHTRLMQHLEQNNLISPVQFGFRKNHSTTDALMRLQAFISENKTHGRYTAAIFFDLKKAYDTIWKYGLIRDLPRYNIKGHMAKYIYNFLQNRTFRVKVGSTLSTPREQQEGVPQGSVLSCSLFLLAINSITTEIPPEVKCSLFVDDVLIYASSARQSLLERRLQGAVNKIESWATAHGLQFAPAKTVGIYFRSHHQSIHPPSITLYNEQVSFRVSAKFLGMTIDSGLSWKQHVDTLKTDCIKRLQLLKCLSHKTWGSDRKTMLRVYRAVVRSKIDYGCIVYQTASQVILNKINPIHNMAIRLCTGAFRSSPTVSLYVESGEQPLHLRRQQLSLQYAVRVKQLPHSLAWTSIHQLDEESGHHTLSIRTSDPDPVDLRLPNIRVLKVTAGKLPYWRIPIHVFCGEWKHRNKSAEHPIILRGQFVEHLRLKHGSSVHLYTDGSKCEDAVGCSVVTDGEVLRSRRLVGEASVYSSELLALADACELIYSRDEFCFSVFSDSKSALDSLQRVDNNHPLVSKILLRILLIIAAGKTIKFCWVPGHVNVSGNERADKAAKSASTSEALPLYDTIPARDYYPYIKKAIKHSWQQLWDEILGNKLKQIKPSINEWNYEVCPNRHSELVLCRLRIGHTRLTHGHLMERGPPPYCGRCFEPLTIVHVLVECPRYSHIRRRLFPTLRGNNTTDDLAAMLAERQGSAFAIERLIKYVTECNLLKDI